MRARSAYLTHPLRTRRERSWHDVTLGTVLRNLAGEHGLQPRIAPKLDSIVIPHLDQTEESDANLLTRLAQRYDAVAAIKAGSLIFAPIGAGVTPTGKPLPGTSITRAAGDQRRFSIADREVYSGVRAYWHDKAGADRKSVLVGRSGNAKRLRESYANDAEARDHAQAEWNRIQRGAAQLSYTLALGRADLYPEQKLRVSGFKPEIDGTAWLIEQLVHRINGSAGFTTSLELQTVAGS